MRRLSLTPILLVGLLAALLVASCGPRPGAVQGYRSDSSITSIVFFDAGRFSGRWYEVAAFRDAKAAPCANARSDYTQRPDGGLDVSGTSCARSGAVRGQAVVTGPGRLTVTLGDQTDTYWMLWVDEGYRTAVVGMPSGKIGFILNRDPVIPADRLRAAREILDWNGYDLGRLVTIPQT